MRETTFKYRFPMIYTSFEYEKVLALLTRLQKELTETSTQRFFLTITTFKDVDTQHCKLLSTIKTRDDFNIAKFCLVSASLKTTLQKTDQEIIKFQMTEASCKIVDVDTRNFLYLRSPNLPHDDWKEPLADFINRIQSALSYVS